MIGASWLNGSWGVLHPQLRLAQHKCHFKFFILMRDNLNKWKKHIYLTENIRINTMCSYQELQCISFTLYFGKCVICLWNGKMSDESKPLPEHGPLHQGHTVMKMIFPPLQHIFIMIYDCKNLFTLRFVWLSVSIKGIITLFFHFPNKCSTLPSIRHAPECDSD